MICPFSRPQNQMDSLRPGCPAKDIVRSLCRRARSLLFGRAADTAQLPDASSELRPFRRLSHLTAGASRFL